MAGHKARSSYLQWWRSHHLSGRCPRTGWWYVMISSLFSQKLSWIESNSGYCLIRAIKQWMAPLTSKDHPGPAQPKFTADMSCSPPGLQPFCPDWGPHSLLGFSWAESWAGHLLCSGCAPGASWHPLSAACWGPSEGLCSSPAAPPVWNNPQCPPSPLLCCSSRC